MRRRTLLVLLAGLLFGGLAGYGVKASRGSAVAQETEVPEMDMAQFALAGTMDAGVALARQLAAADAEKCAALAKAMLAKRVKVPETQDPFAAAESVKMRDAYLPESSWEGLFKRWMNVAPQAAWEFVMAHHSDELPLRAAALRQWALLDPEAAVKAAGSELKDSEKRLILKACVESDPAMGLKFLAEWGLEYGADGDSDSYDPYDSSSYDTLLEKLLKRYAARSPAAAMEWCEAHTSNHTGSVCVGWMRHDAAACMEWIRSQSKEDQQRMMYEICNQEDVTAASMRYLASLEENRIYFSSVEDGLLSIAKRDDALAQSLIDELFAIPTERLFARSKIAHKLAHKNPRVALEFMMPSLRTALPLFESARDIDSEPELPSAVGRDPFKDPFVSENFLITHVIGSYLQLGSAAGVDKAEVLSMLNQIHPQYHACIVNDYFTELRNVLGPAAEWLQPYVATMNREQIDLLVQRFPYDSPDAAQEDILSMKNGPLRNALTERYLEMLLDIDEPMASVLERVGDIGGEGVDLGSVYSNWVEKEPAAALQHFANDPHPSANEWQSVIKSGYETHASEVQDMVEKLPSGDIRNAAAKTLADTAMAQDNDFVTSMYWATEITNRMDRVKMMREVFEAWGENESAMNDAAIRGGMLANIENSALDEKEKALWLERMESEVSR